MQRVIIEVALLAVCLACAACKSNHDDPKPGHASEHADAGEKGGTATQGGHKPGSGLFDKDGGVLEFDDAGRLIERDAATAAHEMKDGGAISNGDAGTVSTQPPSMSEVPVDPGARGPWAVGVRTLQVDLGSGTSMPAEVWYPAEWQSEAGKTRYTYELADWLPPEARAELPADELPIPIACDCYRDLPIDSAHGPYPVSIVVHALSGARVEAATLAAHWASRGFIVVAADHPQLTLADTWAFLNDSCSGSKVNEDLARTRDVPAELRALSDAKGDWEFLADRADLTKVAVSGRVLGAEFAVAMSGQPGVRLIMLWSASLAVSPKGDLAGVAYITGQEDSIYMDSYATVKSGFNTTAGRIKPTVLVGVERAASQSITPYCNAKSAQGLDGEHLQTKYHFCGINFGDVVTRSDCQPQYITQEQADTIFGYVTTAALEETLMGKDPKTAWSGFQPAWGELIEDR